MLISFRLIPFRFQFSFGQNYVLCILYVNQKYFIVLNLKKLKRHSERIKVIRYVGDF